MPRPSCPPRVAPRAPLGSVIATAILTATLALGVVSGGVPAVADTPTPSATPAPSTPPPTTYYVACASGAASGHGKIDDPWTSLSFVTKHGAFKPGENVLLKRGSTCKGGVSVHGSGTATARLTLGAYGSGARPVIAGGGTKSGTGAVQLVNVAYWTVQDLHVTNTAGKWNPSQYRAGVLFRSTTSTRQLGLVAQHLTVDHVDSNPGGSGDTRAYGGIVAQTTKNAAGFGGMQIRNNSVVGVGRTGIAVFNRAFPKSSDRDVRISYNSVRWARGDSIVVSGVDYGRIDHNVSAYGSNMSTCPKKQCGPMGGPATSNAAIWPTLASHVRIDHNEVYGEHRSSGDGSAIDVDLGANKVTVEQNYLHDNERGGVMFCGAHDTVVRFNVLEHNKQSAMWFTCGWTKDQRVRNITITNNDIVANASAPYVIQNMHPNPGRNIRFTNNLVSCSGPCRYSWPNKPFAASNTYAGTRSATEPKGSGTRHGALGLKSPGTGKNGFSSLKGYHVKKKGGPGVGVAISGSVSDVFDKRVNARKPTRGAASS